jgi:ubiquinone/menaquinone biosynthesis C-methylase UbiE
MPTILDRAAYRAGQQLRQSWYLGQKWISGRLAAPVALPPEIRERMPKRDRLRQDLAALVAADWENIVAGHYLPPSASAATPWRALRRSARFFADLPKVEARRRAGGGAEIRRQDPPPSGYPRYYLQNFHFQTDGYLSRNSAELYDHQVEVLFGGAADLMRRQALVPLGRLVHERGQRRTALVDLGCGTGRLLREIKTNFPRMKVTGLDLSPFYLAKARELLSDWSGTQLIAASATSVPMADQSVDAALCCFLFHELPDKPRSETVREMARILKPGGMAIMIDSIQLGDEPAYDALIDYFPHAFHEPYYRHYAATDLGKLFTTAGLVLEESRRVYLSKLMCFRKPV